MDRDKLAAYQTLYEVLKDIALLAAPIAPFFMERLWLDLVPGADSVHYVKMSDYDPSVVDKDLEERMDIAQRASSMVLALRRKVSIKVRQPLSKLVVPVIDEKVKEQLEKVKAIILGEVNVKEAEFISDSTGLITKKIKPNFKTLGKRYGKQMKEIAAAFAQLGQEQIAAIQASENTLAPYCMELPSGNVMLEKGDYEITSEDMPGWLVASDGPLTIALDVTITEELRREGTARELVNRIQNLRKDSGFEVTDKISVVIYASGDDFAEISSSLADFGEYVAAQTLAKSVEVCPDQAPETAAEVEWNEGMVRIEVARL